MRVISNKDTICAIATPPGAGGIGVVRISSYAFQSICEKLLQAMNVGIHVWIRFNTVILSLSYHFLYRISGCERSGLPFVNAWPAFADFFQ